MEKLKKHLDCIISISIGGPTGGPNYDNLMAAAHAYVLLDVFGIITEDQRRELDDMTKEDPDFKDCLDIAYKGRNY